MIRLHEISKLFIGIVLGLLVCLGLQGFVYFGYRGGSAKTESNYFSTISRFQSAVAPGAEIALVGSSISGRLPGRESGNDDVANLGSDGGSSLDGLTLLEEKVVGSPKWIVLETNTLFGGRMTEMPAVSGTRGLWFRIGGVMPLLGASARPTGMMYGNLLGRNWRGTEKAFPLQHIPSAIPEATLRDEDLTTQDRQRIDRLGSSLLRVMKSGARILMVRYPAGILKPRQVDEMNTVIALLHQRTGVPYLDLDSQIPRSELIFSDSVHLGPESAARVLTTLRRAINHFEQAPP